MHPIEYRFSQQLTNRSVTLYTVYIQNTKYASPASSPHYSESQITYVVFIILPLKACIILYTYRYIPWSGRVDGYWINTFCGQYGWETFKTAPGGGKNLTSVILYIYIYYRYLLYIIIR